MNIFIFRQQSLHLGISNVTVDGSNIANDTTSIIENKQSTNLSMPISPTSVLKYENDRSNLSTPPPPPPSSSMFTSVQPNLSINNTTISSLLPNESGSKTIQNSMVSTMNSNQIDSHQNKKFASSISLSPNIATTNANITATNTVTASTASIFQPSQIILQSTISATNTSKTNEPHKIMHHNIKSTLTAMKNAENMHRSDTTFIGHINVLIHNISVINWSDKDDFEKSEREWMSTMAQS